MNILISVSTVFFGILCILLIIIVLLQSNKSAGMGILGGSSQSAFGSSTADVITKITSIMIAIFMLGSLGLAVLESNRSSSLEKKVLSSEKDKSAGLLNEGAKPAEKDSPIPGNNKETPGN